ncbi:MAG: YidH family protein [Candidatus Binataceae bacterium]
MTQQANAKEKVIDATTLAVDRTRLAYDRTLLAWVRTGTSLITFGFTIYKFFQLESARLEARPDRLIGPRQFAFLMIVIGIVSLLLATLEHRRDMKALRAQYPGEHRTLAGIIAGSVSLLGLVALVAVVFRQ